MGTAHVTDVTDSNFTDEVLQSETPVLVDFWATWCAPCKAIAPAIEKVAAEHQGKLKVVKLDVQSNMKTAMSYQVTNIPTFLVFAGGEVVGRQVGTGGGIRAIQTLVQPHLAQ